MSALTWSQGVVNNPLRKDLWLKPFVTYWLDVKGFAETLSS